MTSQINFTLIDETFPVSGIDNDSQVFRDNFSAIKNALETAKTEISTLHDKAVLNSTIDTNVPAVNNLFLSQLTNGSYYNFYGTAKYITVTDDYTVNVSSASSFYFTLENDARFTFNNWPMSGINASVKLHFKSDGRDTWLVEDLQAISGRILKEDSFSLPITLNVTTNTISVTASSSTTNEFTAGSTENLIKNQPIIFSVENPNVIFGGVSVDTVYYVKNIVDSTRFTISPVIVNGIAGDIKVLTQGTGTMVGTVSTTRDKVIEVWSPNAGVDVFVKYVGEFQCIH